MYQHLGLSERWNRNRDPIPWHISNTSCHLSVFLFNYNMALLGVISPHLFVSRPSEILKYYDSTLGNKSNSVLAV